MHKLQTGNGIVGGVGKGFKSHRWMDFHMEAEEEYIKVKIKRQEDLNPLTQTPHCERVEVVKEVGTVYLVPRHPTVREWRWSVGRHSLLGVDTQVFTVFHTHVIVPPCCFHDCVMG